MKKLSIAILLAAWASTAAADPLMAQAQSIYQASGAPSAVVVVVTPGGIDTIAFGASAPGSGKRADEKSLIRINSTSKVLAAHVALQMAAEGKVGLDAPYGPKAPVTLRQLITHTSGLPREVDLEYPESAAAHTWPTADIRSAWLARQNIAPSQGATALYSNLGYNLLADALARTASRPYPQLLRERITGPLGMSNTTSAPTAEQCARLLRGAGKEEACADTSATAGTGGMYSTPRDMATFMRYMLGLHPKHKPQAGSLDTLVSRTALKTVTGLDHGGPATGIGYGWVALAPTADRPAIMQKTGGGAGFMSYMALAPSAKVGVFVVVTRVDMPMMQKLVGQTLDLVQSVASPAGPASTP